MATLAGLTMVPMILTEGLLGARPLLMILKPSGPNSLNFTRQNGGHSLSPPRSTPNRGKIVHFCGQTKNIGQFLYAISPKRKYNQHAAAVVLLEFSLTPGRRNFSRLFSGRRPEVFRLKDKFAATTSN
jgi:hypothetical protein